MSDFLINAGLFLTYIMVVGGALAAIIFPAMFLAKNPEKAKGALKGIGGLIAVFVISTSLHLAISWNFLVLKKLV